MRTFKQVSPHAYVKNGVGQKQYSMYTTSPSGSPSPTVPFSPPPWDGSAEGYGPAATDFQEYYNAVDLNNPPRWGARGMGGCSGGCGMGAMSLAGQGFLFVGGVAVLGYLLGPSLKVKKLTGAILGAGIGAFLFNENVLPG